MLRLFKARPRLLILGVVLVAAAGYVLWWLGIPSPTISILDADIHRQEDGSSLGTLEISRSDVRAIVRREYSTRVSFFSCSSSKNAYYAELSVNKIELDNLNQMSQFLDRNTQASVTLSFVLPKQISERYRDRCVTLSGGQMVGFGRITSNVVRIR